MYSAHCTVQYTINKNVDDKMTQIPEPNRNESNEIEISADFSAKNRG